MGFQEICEAVVDETDGALECLVVDLKTGLTLAMAQRPGGDLDEAEKTSVLRSGEEIFRGKLINQFVRSLPTDHQSAKGFVHEAQISTAYTYQFMATVPRWEDGIVILITEKTLNLGLGWMAVHQAREQLAESPRGAAPEAPKEPSHKRPEQRAHAAAVADSPAPVPRERQRSVRQEPSVSTTKYATSDAQSAKSPTPEWRDTPTPTAPERFSQPGADPTPVPPVRQAEQVEQAPTARDMPAPQTPVPNPLVAKSPVAEPVVEETVASELPAEDQPEVRPPVFSGPRARMFNPKQSKKKKR